jgi:endoglucanase
MRLCLLIVVAAVCALSAAPAAAQVTPPPDSRGVDPASPNPLAGQRLFVDPEQPAWRQFRTDRNKHLAWAASTIWPLAREPKFQWFGRWTHGVRGQVRRYISRAQATRSVPLMTVMRHQGKKCGGGYRGGGGREDARTRRWYQSFAQGVGSARVVIAFEPDSLGTIDCLNRSRRRARLRLLAYGVDVLSRLPGATVYLEGGASDWEPARRTARQLRIIGIAKVRGFMLNVTHYDWTAANIRHGLDISRRVGGKPFVINTSQNGRGPVSYRSNHRRINIWCNPGLRGLGPPPTTQTSHPKVDAYLWLNRPGYAQGCQGRPIAWYPPRALGYARLATTWESPPRGSRFGHFKRYPLSAFGIPR